MSVFWCHLPREDASWGKHVKATVIATGGCAQFVILNDSTRGCIF
jgi:hypothetical protein